MSSDSSHKSSGSTASDAMRAALERQLRDPLDGAATCVPPPVPDHTLLHRIGHGAYGDVWLARNALGTLRAVKVVYRARFKEDRPYEREFNGILKYEPLSRTHEGLVQVLHVGRNDAAGCDGSGNRLVVNNGGTVFASNDLRVGATSLSASNRVVVDGGTQRVANAAGTGTLDVRRGTNALNAGFD